MLLLSILLCCFSIVYSQQIVSCEGDIKLGDSKCKGAKPSIKYFFDVKLQRCYPFLYQGCNPGANQYDTEGECMHCLAGDSQSCGGNSTPTGSCQDEPILIGGPPPKLQCPKGSTCHRGSIVGLCCDDKKEAEWDKEINPKCAKGSIVTEKTWFGTQNVLGLKCEHKFCPSGSECIQGKVLAYCCKK